MVKIGFITLTNSGYLEYTNNLIKSLENINFEGLKVYCIDDKAFNNLNYDRKLKIDNPEEEEVEDFYSFRSCEEWAKIMFQKFRIIYRELKKNDFVLFTDGDIIYRDKRFMNDLLNRIDDNDVLFQNDKQNDDDHSELCAGFQFIKSNEKTLNFYNPDNVSLETILNLKCDQPYINKFKSQLKYNLLPLKKYPNGKYYEDNKNNSYMIHYNYLIGHDKKSMMKKNNHWFL
jgi:hypothetical protein